MESDGGREAIRPATAEEAAVKRNTDCVYFLASPLTCKKGSECEYRHSEGARINPRDCWYWLNGNCLNPKCSFRHPPLDSLFATPMPNSGAVPPSQTAASTQILASRGPNNNNKQSVPCYYFQWGQCLKGDWCPFVHGPQASLSSVSQQVAKASASLAEAPQVSKKDSQQNITVHQNVSELNLDKPKTNVKNHIELSTATEKTVAKAENLLNHEFSGNMVLPPYSLNEEPPSPPLNITSIDSGYSQSKHWGHHVQPTDEQPENGRDADEFLQEYSPGFDVLVEDDVKDPDYYLNEDSLIRVSTHGGQTLEPEDDYDYRPSDYEHIARIERDRCNGIGKYDNYEEPRGRYGCESKITSRSLDKPSLHKRRLLDREARSNEMHGSDLRHQLKQRRLDGSKSTSNRDGRGEHSRRGEHYAEERHYGHHSRDEGKFPRERPLSTRLQGRIVLPGRSSTDMASNLLERERGRRPRGRLSPIRQMNYQARHPEEIRQQPSEEFNEDVRMGRNKSSRRDDVNSLDFAGPKSLAELKGSKIDDSSNEESIKGDGSNTRLNRVKSGKVLGSQESQTYLSFRGPMPLSVILKKKRESAHADSELSADPYDHNSGGEPAIDESVLAAVPSLQSVPTLETRKQRNETIASHDHDEYVTTPAEDDELPSDGQSPTKAGAMETEEGAYLENANEEELENYNQRDGDFDYESGEYKADEDENTFHADEDDLDDEDDFARKVSVMLS